MNVKLLFIKSVVSYEASSSAYKASVYKIQNTQLKENSDRRRLK